MTRRTMAVCLAACLASAATLSAAASDIRVTPLVSDGRVFVSFAAPAAFGDDNKAVVQSGLLLTLTFTIELRRPSTMWLDRTVGAVTVASSVKFDNLTGIYQVSKLQDGRVVWSERTPDAAQVREWMTTFDRVGLVPEETLEPNADYYLRVRMQASPKRTLSIWPFGGEDGSGRSADFTFIR